MLSLEMRTKAVLQSLAAMVLFATLAAAQIPNLCDTGQTEATPSACASEWVTPYDGDHDAAGWYVYRTTFPVPPVLPSGAVPTGVTINGQLASDNATVAIYLESPANRTAVAAVQFHRQNSNRTGLRGQPVFCRAKCVR